MDDSRETVPVGWDLVETFQVDPPQDMAQQYSDSRVRISYVLRQVNENGDVHITFRGVPLSKHGREVGLLDTRWLLPDDAQRLTALLPPMRTVGSPASPSGSQDGAT